jgi:hypothetical protein
MSIIKTATLVDSKGIPHVFNLIRCMGGYSFTWDGKDVDWSFTVHGYNKALWHFNFICEDVHEINYMNSWVND